MSQKEKDKLLDHDADGIQEYDNSLPRWWLYGFYLTIVLACVYMFYYHIYTGPDWNFLWYGPRTQEAEYAAETKLAAVSAANAPKKAAVPMVLRTDSESLAKGKEIFNSTSNLCFTCHREDLGGQVGPNLTDEYWIHGCSVKDIATSIRQGFADKGMLPFGTGNRLTDDELVQVASYILSMKGTNPPDPKPIEEGRDVKCDSQQSQEPS